MLVAAGIGAGAVIAYRATALPPGAPACAAQATTMARLELLFGGTRKDGGEISDADWQAFVDAEVTPRFPDGLTVLTGYGQWRNKAGTVAKERSRVLIVWYQPAADANTRIEAVRAAYKARFGQDSVMRVDGLSCVSF
jgi:hypothetical protein